jgi:hypothetical protein
MKSLQTHYGELWKLESKVKKDEKEKEVRNPKNIHFT